MIYTPSVSNAVQKNKVGEDIAEMKRRTLGFALLLFGNIFAVPEALFFYIGLLMGIIGLCLVISGIKSDT